MFYIIDTSNIDYIDHYQKKKNEKVIGLWKDQLGGKIRTKFAGLEAKTYSYLIDDNKKKEKVINCVVKRKLKFENYNNYLVKHFRIK